MPTITLPTPNYAVEQTKKGRSHVYKVTAPGQEDRFYPGVTGILSIIDKPALRHWYAKQAIEKARRTFLSKLKKGKLTIKAEDICSILEESKSAPDEIKDEAADTGTICHSVFDSVVMGKPMPEYPAELKPTIERFMRWYEESKMTVISGDTSVASTKYGYGGALDAIGMLGEAYVLIDFKTSNGIYDTYALQVAAYAQALLETYSIDCKDAVILRFGKEPKNGVVPFEPRWVTDWKAILPIFAHALNLQRGLKCELFRD